MSLQDFAAEMAGKQLPAGPKVMCALVDGCFAVKVQVDDKIGYVVVDAEETCTGELLTLADVATRRGLTASSR